MPSDDHPEIDRELLFTLDSLLKLVSSPDEVIIFVQKHIIS